MSGVLQAQGMRLERWKRLLSTQLYARATPPAADHIKLLQQLSCLSDLLLELPFGSELFQRIAPRALERLGVSLSGALASEKILQILSLLLAKQPGKLPLTWKTET